VDYAILSSRVGMQSVHLLNNAWMGSQPSPMVTILCSSSALSCKSETIHMSTAEQGGGQAPGLLGSKHTFRIKSKVLLRPFIHIETVPELLVFIP
jgi:hypothetical protein